MVRKMTHKRGKKTAFSDIIIEIMSGNEKMKFSLIFKPSIFKRH